MKIILLFLISFHFSTLAQETAPTFVDGVKAYESKEYQKSKEIFSTLLEAHPNNPMLMFNLGLNEYQLGNKGLALGLWRKARFLNPSANSTEQAIEYVQKELFPDQNDGGVFHTIYDGLKIIPLQLWLLLSLFSFFTFTWFAITFTAKRKIPVSHWPYWQYLLIPIFLFTLSFSLVLVFQKNKIRATVIARGINTQTGPSETAPTLSSLIEGELVTVHKRVDNWAQIRTMRGAPGWVELKNIIILER